MDIVLRELKGKDRKSILKILNKSGIKLADIYKRINGKVISATKDEIKIFESELNEEDYKKFSELTETEQKQIVSNSIKGAENVNFMLSIIDNILENEDKIDEELHLFISDLSGIPVKEIDELSMKEYTELFIEVKDLFVNSGFFTTLESK